MPDISGTGMSIIVKASKTYPQGILITSFPGDTDPFDFPDITITQYEMGLNGDIITWSSPQPLPFSLSVIPNSAEDIALSYLLEANRVAKGKKSANDDITIVGNYPNGEVKILQTGRIVSGPPAKGVSQDGKTKTPTYSFVFQNKI